MKIIYIFGNCCSLRSQSCLKHSTKRVNEVEWVSKVKVILWPWSKVTQISKLNVWLLACILRWAIQGLLALLLRMYGWMQFYTLFNNFSVISGWWASGNERLYAMEPGLWVKKSPPQVGLKHRAPRSVTFWTTGAPYLYKPLKRQAKLQQTTLLFFYFYLLKKIWLDISCESSARQRIHMKYQALFSLKNNEKVFMNVVCCSHDWHFKG